MIPEPDSVFTKITTSMFAFGLGLMFGMLKYAQEFLNGSPPPFIWWVAMIKGVTAGAVGWIAMALSIEWGLYESHPYLTGVVIAVAGWGGVDFLNAASRAIQEGISDYLRRRFSDTGPD